jgi:hypothetical protein
MAPEFSQISREIDPCARRLAGPIQPRRMNSG